MNTIPNVCSVCGPLSMFYIFKACCDIFIIFVFILKDFFIYNSIIQLSFPFFFMLTFKANVFRPHTSVIHGFGFDFRFYTCIECLVLVTIHNYSNLFQYVFRNFPRIHFGAYSSMLK